MDKECSICGEMMAEEVDVSGDDESQTPRQVATYFSICPNECRECGEHKNEDGICPECDKEE